ncbi:hypothetical protein [uncultured Varibaculum sp.]|uniref:hypothetical protein n=1 Tax=uncultured Varibaculum sp. TaxID=413896 RepID=UPI00288A3167|nr:hypothetical protein [uncultured Varibaculum sp.]
MGKHAKPRGKRKYVLALALTIALSFSGTFSAMALWKDTANAPGIKVQTETFSAMGVKANGELKNLFSKQDVDSKECNALAVPMEPVTASGKPFKVNLDISPKLPGYTYSVSAVDDPSKCSCGSATGKQEDIPSTAKYACVVAKVTGIDKEKDAGTYSNVGTATGMDESGNEVKAEDTWSAKLIEKYRDGQPITAKVNLYREDVRCK